MRPDLIPEINRLIRLDGTGGFGCVNVPTDTLHQIADALAAKAAAQADFNARILSSIIPATKGGEDVAEALKAYQGLASAVMTALLGNETRDDLLLADKVHQAHGKARVALAALAQDTDGVAR